jgi:hypothetical protein
MKTGIAVKKSFHQSITWCLQPGAVLCDLLLHKKGSGAFWGRQLYCSPLISLSNSSPGRGIRG